MGSQTPRLDRPARRAGRPTTGRKRVDNVAAGVVVALGEEALAAGGAVVVAVGVAGAAEGVAVATFKEEGNPTAIVRVEGLASRMAGRIKGDPIKAPNEKGRPS
jgi:hypothetical protein